MHDGEASFPLEIGNFSLGLVWLNLAFISLLLFNKFFEFKSTLFLCLTGFFSICIVWSLENIIPLLPFVQNPDILAAASGSNTAKLAQTLVTVISFILIAFIHSGFLRFLKRKLGTLVLFLMIALASSLVATSTSLMLPKDAGPILANLFTLGIQWTLLSLLHLPIYFILNIMAGFWLTKEYMETLKEKLTKKKGFLGNSADPALIEVRKEIQENRLGE